jgi:hypothetical protein
VRKTSRAMPGWEEAHVVDAQEKNGRDLDRIVFFSHAVFAITPACC